MKIYKIAQIAIQVNNEDGSYNVVHKTTRPDTPKWQITRFLADDTPAGHQGESTLVKALDTAGYFKKELEQVVQYRAQYSKAKKLLAEREITDLGKYAYISPLRPLGFFSPLTKDAIAIDVDMMGVIFRKTPFLIDTINNHDLSPVNSEAFYDYCKQKINLEYPEIKE